VEGWEKLTSRKTSKLSENRPSSNNPLLYLDSISLLGMEKESEKRMIHGSIECQADEIWNVLGKAWALLILKKLIEKDTTRFNEIKKSIPQISNTVLSERLREFEEQGLIIKKVYAQVPTRVEYSLTKQARNLEKILEQLDEWVIKWRKEKPTKR
jgi:DNA-binding HxlR family transcriptional regulator